MRPAFAPADLLVITPKPIRDIRVGDVITYSIPIGDHHLETHRILALHWRRGEPVVRTQGDANLHPDPWIAQLHGATVWHTSFVLPNAGRPILWLRQPVVHRSLVFVAPVLFALLGLFSIWGRTDRLPRGHPSGVGSV
jgi:signal peptidase